MVWMPSIIQEWSRAKVNFSLSANWMILTNFTRQRKPERTENEKENLLLVKL